jgi:hypothetical protein
VPNTASANRTFDVFAKEAGKWKFKKRIEADSQEHARHTYYEEVRTTPLAWIAAYPR